MGQDQANELKNIKKLTSLRRRWKWRLINNQNWSKAKTRQIVSPTSATSFISWSIIIGVACYMPQFIQSVLSKLDSLNKQHKIVLLYWLSIQDSTICIFIFVHILMVSINIMWWSFNIGMAYNMLNSISAFFPYSDGVYKQHIVVHLHWPGIQDATVHISICVQRP